MYVNAEGHKLTPINTHNYNSCWPSRYVTALCLTQLSAPTQEKVPNCINIFSELRTFTAGGVI